MKVSDIYQWLDHLAPFATAEPWDNVGLLVGDGEQEVTGILTALDVTLPVLEEAAKLGYSLLVSHHPVIFAPVKQVKAGEPVYEAARRGISVIAAHTNLDVAKDGVNTALARQLGLLEVAPLAGEGERYMGCVGRLPHPMSPDELSAHLCTRLDMPPRYNPQGAGRVTHLGLCGGSGAELLMEALPPYPYQAFLTADVKHHQFVEAARRGITLYDGGHYATEVVVIPELTTGLQQAFPGIGIQMAESYNGYLNY